MDDEESSPLRPVLIGLGALVAVSLLVGGVISVLALGVADVAGVGGDDSAASGPTVEPSMYVPTPTPSPEPTESPDPEPTQAGTGEETTEPSEPKTTKEAAQRRISLSASPSQVSSMQRIDLTGHYPGGDGATLQVQRQEGGWSDFPVDASVTGSTFSTYVQTGRSGQNRFRVVDQATGRVSNPVSVRVG